ncbi:MAG: hypothetical protein N2491_06485 [Negativicutes bacterium]|nr:hypothetical protein [Negativicutes bacterium]
MKRHLSFAVTAAAFWYGSLLLFKLAWQQLGLPLTDASSLLLAVMALPVSLYVGWSSYYKK